MSHFVIDLENEISTAASQQETVGEEQVKSTPNSAAADEQQQQPPKKKNVPTCVIIIGMAGAGKTTLMHRINLDMIALEKRGYYINLDPAVRDVPFGANIDIRDTVNYKEVMKQYGLGPNGGILTSLNLFATRFDQVIQLLERRSEELDYIFIDTPGQIETFTWSAGGQIILELLATSFPTVIMYITDTPRCTSPTTFMSNMLYASSVLYKSQLPMVCVFNKTDVEPFEFAKRWMEDFEAYQEAVDENKFEEYMGSLNRSLALAMEEFYSNIKAVGVSAATGDGIPDLFSFIDECRIEFQETYLPDLLKRIALREQAEKAKQQTDLLRLQEDLKSSRGDKLVVDVRSNGTLKHEEVEDEEN